MAPLRRLSTEIVFVVVVLIIPISAYKKPMTSAYNVNEGSIGDLKTMVISNVLTNEMVEIVTDFGGRVEKLVLNSRTTGVTRDVLLGHHGNSSSIVENQYWRGMLLLPWANRIAYGRYSFFNSTYVLPLNDPPRKNSLHGFMAGKILKVIDTEWDNDHGSFVALTQIINEPGYPFSLDVVITYTLNKYGFSITVNATNTNGNGMPLPFYMGWHPYFKCTAYTSYVTLDPCQKWAHVQLNDNMNPTGITQKTEMFDGSTMIGGNETDPTFYDDEYKPLAGPLSCENGHAKLFDTATNQAVVLWYDAAFHYVHIFTGSSSMFHEDSIAMEPMCGMADAYNNHDGLTVLSDGETWSGSFGVYVE